MKNINFFSAFTKRTQLPDNQGLNLKGGGRKHASSVVKNSILCFAMAAAMLTACNENPDDKGKEGEGNATENAFSKDASGTSILTIDGISDEVMQAIRTSGHSSASVYAYNSHVNPSYVSIGSASSGITSTPITIKFPDTVPSNMLRTATDFIPRDEGANLVVEPADAKFMRGAILAGTSDNNCRLERGGTDNSTWELDEQYWYVDKDVSINGTFTYDTYPKKYSLTLKAGWNVVYQYEYDDIDEDMSNNLPSGRTISWTFNCR
jgi:hypothetical protein